MVIILFKCWLSCFYVSLSFIVIVKTFIIELILIINWLIKSLHYFFLMSIDFYKYLKKYLRYIFFIIYINFYTKKKSNYLFRFIT